MMKDTKNTKDSIIDVIYREKFSFIINFFLVFLITFSILYLFGYVPDEFKITVGRYPGKEIADGYGDLPMVIKIPKIGVDSQIYNPATTTISTLNNYLLKGAVRYPGSGLLGGKGNMFIFGHSTGLKIVQNQAYKTFSNIQKLSAGDEISVFSDNSEYVYKVILVKHVDATKELIEFNTKERMLTLSTCDNFGAKTDRYVVEAEFAYKR